MPKSAPCEQVRRLNRAIDQALLDPAQADIAVLRVLSGHAPPDALAERVRRRANALIRRAAHIVQNRDALIAAIYAAAAPRGWFNAWCDGASRGTRPRRAGIGGLVLAPDGRIAQFAQPRTDLDAFAAEIAALTTVLDVALEQGAERLRVHTDCPAFVHLWHARRADPRLAPIRALARRFRRLELRTIPREHNQPANRLARQAMNQSAQNVTTVGD